MHFASFEGVEAKNTLRLSFWYEVKPTHNGAWISFFYPSQNLQVFDHKLYSDRAINQEQFDCIKELIVPNCTANRGTTEIRVKRVKCWDLELKCYLTDSSATVYGFEHFTGHIGDKPGWFVLEHVGKFENGVLRSKRTVVKGSGKVELTGILGEINFESGSAEEFQITLNYYFE